MNEKGTFHILLANQTSTDKRLPFYPLNYNDNLITDLENLAKKNVYKNTLIDNCSSICVIYKKTKDTDLKVWVFNPKDHVLTKKKPAIIFFFGGGYRSGTPDQFVEHAKYLSSRGMVAILADYRVSSRHDVKVINSISDHFQVIFINIYLIDIDR